MLLQISTDSLNNGYSLADQPDNSIYYYIGLLIIFSIIFYYFIIHKSDKPSIPKDTSPVRPIINSTPTYKDPPVPSPRPKDPSPKQPVIIPIFPKTDSDKGSNTQTPPVVRPTPVIVSDEKIIEVKKEPDIAKPLVKKGPSVKSPKEVKAVSLVSNKASSIIVPEKEEQSKAKYIGYNPINIFAQSEPLSFPYVSMPKANCIIKFPRKGRTGRKGYKEEEFNTYISEFFNSNFQIFDDRFILVKNSSRPFEPDFTLIDEKEGLNLFLDIEIDEPYEGLNNIGIRKATHYQYADTNRNNAFVNRGWIVIRFAEIQVHQNPIACCRFIADVIRSINPKYKIPKALVNSNQIKPIKQWTQAEAEVWSKEKYREEYLGISSFGASDAYAHYDGLSETELGETIEALIKETPAFIPPTPSNKGLNNSNVDLIKKAIETNTFISFMQAGKLVLMKPEKVSDSKLSGYCYIRNENWILSMSGITNLAIKQNYCTLRVAGPSIGLDQISAAVNTAINYKKYIRMKYTRSSWQSMSVDRETGELLIDKIEAEESIRTINDVQLSINALDPDHISAYNLNSNHITAYCNKREEQRTFRFDRIGEMEILDV